MAKIFQAYQNNADIFGIDDAKYCIFAVYKDALRNLGQMIMATIKIKRFIYCTKDVINE